MSTDISKRLFELEAREAIRDLIADYARICDTGFNGEEMAKLFVEDAVWEANFGAHLTGREEIATFFNTEAALCPFALHFYTNITATIDGETARGRALLLQARTNTDDAGASKGIWMAGDYLNDYVLTPEGWRFKHVRLNIRIDEPATSDWADKPLATTTLG